MRLTQLDAGDHVKLRKIAQQSSQSCGEGLYCQSSPRADLSEIFTVALLSTFSTVSATSGQRPPNGVRLARTPSVVQTLRLQEGQQVGVDCFRLRGRHAMREALVSLQRAVL
jgi:hypothetical protein